MKLSIKLILAALFIYGYCGVVYAEHGCQDGFIPVNQGNSQTCVADYNLPYWGNEEGQKKKAPRQWWEKTWGAIAVDFKTSTFGTSVGKYSKKDATNSALAQCAELGGKECEPWFSYHNQCVVVAWPNVTGDTAKANAVASVQKAATIEGATRNALSDCASSAGGVGCKIVYSECTKPKLFTADS